MTGENEVSRREVQQDLGTICSYIRSLDPESQSQAASMLMKLIGKLRETTAVGTKGGAEIYDLLIRARENLRIDCVQDALSFLDEAMGQANTDWPAAETPPHQAIVEARIPEALSVELVRKKLEEARDGGEHRGALLETIRWVIQSAQARERDIPGHFYYSVDELVKKALSAEDPHEAEKLIDRSLGLCRLQKAAR